MYTLVFRGNSGDSMEAGPFCIFHGETGSSIFKLDPDNVLEDGVPVDMFMMDTIMRAGEEFSYREDQTFKASEPLKLQIDNGKPPIINPIIIFSYEEEAYAYIHSYDEYELPTVFLAPDGVYPPYMQNWDSDPNWFEYEVEYNKDNPQLGVESASGIADDLKIAQTMYENGLESGSYRLMLAGVTPKKEEYGSYNWGSTYALSKPFTIKRLEDFRIPSPNYTVGDRISLTDFPVEFDYGDGFNSGQFFDELEVLTVIDVNHNSVYDGVSDYIDNLVPGVYTVLIRCRNDAVQSYLANMEIPMSFTFTVTNNIVDMAEAFPDELLRAAVYDALGKTVEDEIDHLALTGIKTLDASNKNPGTAGITDLTGLELLLSIEELNLSGNKIAGGELRLPSGTSNLIKLDCSNNNMTSIYLSHFREYLKKLNLSGNYLQSIDVSWHPALESLDCRNNDMLAESDINGLNKALTTDFNFEPQREIIPTQPGTPYIYLRGTKSIAVRWASSTSRDGIREYEVYRDGILLGKASAIVIAYGEYADSGLDINTEYTYEIVAVGNRGGKSEPMTATLSTANLYFETVSSLENQYLMGEWRGINVSVGGLIQPGFAMTNAEMKLTYTGRNTGQTGTEALWRVNSGDPSVQYLFMGLWIIEHLPADTYDIYYTMTDAEGSSADSATQTVALVPDGSSPTITINSPGAGALVGAAQEIKVRGSITDNIKVVSATSEYKIGNGDFVTFHTMTP